MKCDDAVRDAIRMLRDRFETENEFAAKVYLAVQIFICKAAQR